MYNITIFCNRSHVQAQPDSSAAFLQEYSRFCGFQFHSCRNAWIPAWSQSHSCGFQSHSTGFHRILMTGFLQECVGQWKLLQSRQDSAGLHRTLEQKPSISAGDHFFCWSPLESTGLRQTPAESSIQQLLCQWLLGCHWLGLGFRLGG